MTGRYGVDQLSWTLMGGLSIFVSILSRFMNSQVLAILYLIPLVIVFLQNVF